MNSPFEFEIELKYLTKEQLIRLVEELQEENDRLNNIINEFEEEIELEVTIDEKDTHLEHNTFITINETLEKVLERIKELKEGK